VRFFSIYKPDPAVLAAPPSEEYMAKMGAYIEELVKAGVLLATEGFRPHPTDVRIRLEGGKYTVSDGPFTEAKEVIGGFAMLELRSREEAIELTKRFLEVAGGGECEVHQMLDAPELPLEKATR
jgi:hypothetical protein